MQPILNQLLHFPSTILLAICGHLVSLHLNQLSKLPQILACHLLLACACYIDGKCRAPMLPNVSCMTPFRQLMNSLEVAKNGLPRIIGT